jgi:hypothetical protein
MSPTRLEDVRQLIHAYIKERPYSSHVIILRTNLDRKENYGKHQLQQSSVVRRN